MILAHDDVGNEVKSGIVFSGAEANAPLENAFPRASGIRTICWQQMRNYHLPSECMFLSPAFRKSSEFHLINWFGYSFAKKKKERKVIPYEV